MSWPSASPSSLDTALAMLLIVLSPGFLLNPFFPFLPIFDVERILKKIECKFLGSTSITRKSYVYFVTAL